MKFKAIPTYSEISVDREQGVIYGVRVANYGQNKNGSFFDENFIEKLVKDGNSQKRGVKSRFGHPNECASTTSLGSYLGRFYNYSIKEKDAFADLYLDKITRKTNVQGQGIKLFDYIMDMAENNPDAFGNSIVVEAKGFESEPFEDENGEMTTVELLDLKSFKFSDLVGEPAATDSLFSNSEDLGVKLTNFLDENEELFEVVEKNPKIVTDFFERYRSYKSRTNKKVNMSLIDKLKEQFNSKKYDIDLTLLNGNVITVQTEAEQPQQGDNVKDQDGNDVPDDSHKTQDGRTIRTEGGVIQEITETQNDGGGNDNGGNDNGGNSVEESLQEERANREAFEKDVNESLTYFANQMIKFEKTLNGIAKTTGSNYDVPPAEDHNRVNNDASFHDRVKQRKEEIKNKNNDKK